MFKVWFRYMYAKMIDTLHSNWHKLFIFLVLSRFAVVTVEDDNLFL